MQPEGTAYSQQQIYHEEIGQSILHPYLVRSSFLQITFTLHFMERSQFREHQRTGRKVIIHPRHEFFYKTPFGNIRLCPEKYTQPAIKGP